MSLITFSGTVDGSDNIVGNNEFSGSNWLEIYSISTDDAVRFKAFVDTFSDSFTSDWNSEQVLGRMDPIATFKGTKREISIDFSVPATSLEDSKINLQKLSALTQYLYPNYQTVENSKASTMVSAPLVKIKFANLIMDSSKGISGDAKGSGLLGFLGGVNYSPNLEMGTFIDNGHLYPKTYKLSLKFTVIHTTPLGFDERGVQRTAFNYFPYDILYKNIGLERSLEIGENLKSINKQQEIVNDGNSNDQQKTEAKETIKQLTARNSDLIALLGGGE